MRGPWLKRSPQFWPSMSARMYIHINTHMHVHVYKYTHIYVYIRIFFIFIYLFISASLTNHCHSSSSWQNHPGVPNHCNFANAHILCHKFTTSIASCCSSTCMAKDGPGLGLQKVQNTMRSMYV